MSKILFTWELGAGIGHMAPCRALFESLCASGHSLILVLRDLSHAKIIFRGLNVTFAQAPVKTYVGFGNPVNSVPNATTYTHILHNSGYENADELEALVAAWRSIYEWTQPDLVIADHSPTALLALRGFRARKIMIGCGFLIPPDSHPFQTMRPWQPFDDVAMKRNDDQMCARINTVLDRFEQPPLARIGQLFSDVDDTILTTYPELDHYAARTGGKYWGVRESFRGEDFEWPAGDGPRLFAYLRTSPQNETILHTSRAEAPHDRVFRRDQVGDAEALRVPASTLRTMRLLNLKKLAPANVRWRC